MNEIGAPTCIVQASASSGCRAASWAPTSRSFAARSATDVPGHGPWSNASRAAATARSMSPSFASAKVSTTSSVDGETTGSVSAVVGSTHSPPTKSECGCAIESVGCVWVLMG